jgi:uncharacterized protein (DUF3820 family)
MKLKLGDNRPIPDPAYFLQLTQARMPFGKYKDRRLIDLPESYLIWMARKGYPKGLLGVMLKDVYEIKLNGLEGLCHFPHLE